MTAAHYDPLRLRILAKSGQRSWRVGEMSGCTSTSREVSKGFSAKFPPYLIDNARGAVNGNQWLIQCTCAKRLLRSSLVPGGGYGSRRRPERKIGARGNGYKCMLRRRRSCNHAVMRRRPSRRLESESESERASEPGRERTRKTPQG